MPSESHSHSQLTVHRCGPFDQTLHLPGSKSLTNRALLLGALGDGTSVVRGILEADDTQRMRDALGELGFVLETAGAGSTGNPIGPGRTVHGQGGRIPSSNSRLDLGNAGTAIRPLTAVCCLGQGTYALDGNTRMRERPMGELVDGLRQLGGQITYEGQRGYPPLRIEANGLQGGRLTMKPTLSSQFITALLMAAPAMREGLRIDFDGPITSRPYVELTIGLMRRFGIDPHVQGDWTSISVEPGRYTAVDYSVEPDASNATYFQAAAATIPGSRCLIPGLGKRCLQGDARFVDVLRSMGAQVREDEGNVTVSSPRNEQRLVGVDVDLNPMPDAAMTLAVLAAIAEGPTTIRNVGNWRVKETDRMAAIKAELEKLGASVAISEHGQGNDMTITPTANGQLRRPPEGIDTYDDHRMAMSFAVLGLVAGPLRINDPACVNKTFPSFWKTIEQTVGQVIDPPSQ